MMLYQINTRVYCSQLSRALGRPANLDDVPDADLDRWTEMGFEWIWLLSVWQIGEAGRTISRTLPELRREFKETLADLRDEDIGGSGFAITSYQVQEELGGDAALGRLRERMRKRGLRLMLDFVANHSAVDHPWAFQHPDYYVSGTDKDLAREPGNYVRLKRPDVILAHGRDPYFPGWTDTLQLNYGNPEVQQAMTDELLGVAERCDGVRCDMAMLLLPEVFQRTWGIASQPFWPKAIETVRGRHRDFCLLAEAYWDLEWSLQQQGFDYAYDKRLYDRLRAGEARAVREHLTAGLDYQNKLARFLENHDEPRAASIFPFEQHRAAAVITYLSPGLHFFHQGQFEGRKKRISPHLCRAPNEPADREVGQFYERLLAVLRDPIVREGRWQLLQCTPASQGNASHGAFVVFAWEGGDQRRIVVVNYSAHRGQCYVRIPFANLATTWRLQDLMSDATYERDGAELYSRGLHLDEPAWRAAVFQCGILKR